MSLAGIVRRFWSVQRYHAVLYYVRKDIHSWDVDFVILLDLRQHRAVSESVICCENFDKCKRYSTLLPEIPVPPPGGKELHCTPWGRLIWQPWKYQSWKMYLLRCAKVPYVRTKAATSSTAFATDLFPTNGRDGTYTVVVISNLSKFSQVELVKKEHQKAKKKKKVEGKEVHNFPVPSLYPN